MAAGSMERKLVAILSADVTGYCLLMGEDEEGTVRTLMTYRQVMSDSIQYYRGRVVDSPGDNLLAEFASIVDAVQAAIAIQRELKARNEQLPLNRRMEFRIGINLGDVIVEGEQIYGEGVNIAARLEGLAEPSGICVSGTVYDQVEGKLALAFDFEGEHTVKNIAKPMRVYRVDPDSRGKASRVYARWRRSVQRRRRVAALAGLLLILAGGVASWHILLPSPLLVTAMRAPEATALPLPDKPSIAVLPLANLSKDPEQEYFSDGITEDLITSLSKISGLFVIARNSTFTYKDKGVKMEQVSRDLGVRYVLEGSVRKADGHVRITIRLVDAISGYHLWGERYDRELQGIFGVQDEITRKIVTSLAVKLKVGEERPMERSYTSSQEAWDYYVRARELFRQGTKPANLEAREWLNKAIALDGSFARAYATRAATYRREWVWAWGDPKASGSEQDALNDAQKAIALDGILPHGHKQLALIYVYQRQHVEAIGEAEKAVQLDPGDADNYAVLAEVLNYAGDFHRAIANVQTAMRLDPYHSAHYPYVLGQAYYLLGEYQKAEEALEASLTRNPNFIPARAYRAALYWDTDRKPQANAEMLEIRKVIPTPAAQRKSSAPFSDSTITDRLRATWTAAEEGQQKY